MRFILLACGLLTLLSVFFVTSKETRGFQHTFDICENTSCDTYRTDSGQLIGSYQVDPSNGSVTGGTFFDAQGNITGFFSVNSVSGFVSFSAYTPGMASAIQEQSNVAQGLYDYRTNTSVGFSANLLAGLPQGTTTYTIGGAALTISYIGDNITFAAGTANAPIGQNESASIDTFLSCGLPCSGTGITTATGATLPGLSCINGKYLPTQCAGSAVPCDCRDLVSAWPLCNSIDLSPRTVDGSNQPVVNGSWTYTTTMNGSGGQAPFTHRWSASCINPPEPTKSGTFNTISSNPTNWTAPIPGSSSRNNNCTITYSGRDALGRDVYHYTSGQYSCSFGAAWEKNPPPQPTNTPIPTVTPTPVPMGTISGHVYVINNSQGSSGNNFNLKFDTGEKCYYLSGKPITITAYNAQTGTIAASTTYNGISTTTDNCPLARYSLSVPRGLNYNVTFTRSDIDNTGYSLDAYDILIPPATTASGYTAPGNGTVVVSVP